MQRHKRRGNGDRSFQPGKGSAERGSEWRKFYDDINWGPRLGIYGDGFTRVGGKLVKRYGPSEPKANEVAPAVVIH